MKKISGKVYYLRKTMDYLGVALLLSMLYALWILYQGPLSVPFLKPYIIQALNSEESEFTMNVGEVNLELVRSIQPVKIIAKDISFRKNDDKLSITAPSLSLSFSVRALLKGMIAPSSVTFEKPQISIFTTYGVEQGKANEANKKKLTFYIDWIEGFLDRFNAEEKIYPESYITDIAVNDADIEFHEVDLGRKRHFKEVDINFDRHLTDMELDIAGALDLKDRMASIALSGKYELFDSKLLLDFDFSDFLVSDILSEVSENALQVEVPIDGTISARVNFGEILQHQKDVLGNLDKAIEDISFQVKGGDGEVIFNEQDKFNYDIDSFTLNGNISGGLDTIKISDADFETAGQKTKLSLDISGYKQYFFEKSLENLKIVFSSKIDKFKLDDLSKFWPRYLAEPAWEWCKKNLFGGMAENGNFSFEFGYDKNIKSISFIKLDGRADVIDSNISYLEGMPVVRHVYGTAFFSSSDITINVDKGVSDGVIITGGKVKLYDLHKAHNFIDIRVEGNSSIADALKFIDNPPLNYAQGMGVNPDKILGDVEIFLGLNFELHQALEPEDIKVDIKADLTNVKVPNAVDGKSLTAEKLGVEVTSKGFIVIGDAKFDDIPLNLVINETFANKAYKSKGKISFRLDEQVKKKLGITSAILNPPYIDGYADVTADLTILNDDKIRIDLEADLQEASIDYSFLGFKKNKGQWGKIATRLEFANKTLQSVPSFSLSKSDFSVAGDMSLDGKGNLKVVNITDIKGPKTSAKAKIEFSGGKKRQVKINVSGNSYDLTELFDKSDKIRKSSVQNNNSSDDSWTDVTDTDIFIAVNQLWTNPQTPIKNFAGTAILRNGVGVEEAHMVGNYGSDKSIKLKLDYIPRPNGEYLLSVDSNNAGSTLRVLRLYENMTGGILKIEAKRNRNKEFVGHAQIRDFSIRNTPVLAKLLTVASFTGMLDLLTGEGLSFSHFDAPFEYKNNTLYVNEAKMFGNVIGFTGDGLYRRGSEQIDIKGIISPAYSLNSMLGKIPLVGSMLAGKDGTVFAANYKITGSLENPKISINPLSVFSPNSIKEMFSSAFGGKNEQKN